MVLFTSLFLFLTQIRRRSEFSHKQVKLLCCQTKTFDVRWGRVHLLLFILCYILDYTFYDFKESLCFFDHFIDTGSTHKLINQSITLRSRLIATDSIAFGFNFQSIIWLAMKLKELVSLLDRLKRPPKYTSLNLIAQISRRCWEDYETLKLRGWGWKLIDRMSHWMWNCVKPGGYLWSRGGALQLNGGWSLN